MFKLVYPVRRDSEVDFSCNFIDLNVAFCRLGALFPVFRYLAGTTLDLE